MPIQLCVFWQWKEAFNKSLIKGKQHSPCCHHFIIYIFLFFNIYSYFIEKEIKFLPLIFLYHFVFFIYIFFIGHMCIVCNKCVYVFLSWIYTPSGIICLSERHKGHEDVPQNHPQKLKKTTNRKKKNEHGYLDEKKKLHSCYTHELFFLFLFFTQVFSYFELFGFFHSLFGWLR